VGSGALSDVLVTGIDAPFGLRVDADTQATGLDLGRHEERGYDL
jgi:ammonia channel protein AmtB